MFIMATSKLCDSDAGERAKKMKTKSLQNPLFPQKKIRCAAVHFRKMSRTLKKCPLTVFFFLPLTDVARHPPFNSKGLYATELF